MLRFFPKFRPQGLGLDIQKHEIRLVQVRQTRRRMILEKAKVIALAANTIVDGKIQRFDEVQMALLELTAQIKVRRCGTTIGLPANCMISKRLQLPPHLTPLELEMELTSHLSHYFPGIKEVLFYDYMKLLSDDPRYDSIFVVAARSDQIMNYVNVVQSVGLKVAAVDIDLYGLIRAVRAIENIKHSSFVLLDINETHAQLIIIHQEELIFYQSLMADTVHQLLAQLKQAWHLYRGTHPELHLQPAFLLSAQPELVPWVEAELLTATCFIDPLKRFPGSSATSYKLLAAFGLALRAFQR